MDSKVRRANSASYWPMSGACGDRCSADVEPSVTRLDRGVTGSLAAVREGVGGAALGAVCSRVILSPEVSTFQGISAIILC